MIHAIFVMDKEQAAQMSRDQAESGAPTLLISILTPEERPVTPIAYERFRDCLMLDFHDIPFYTEEAGLVPFDGAHARKVIDFILNDADSGVAKSEDDAAVNIVVHCSAGISRSSAVAQFLAETIESVEDFTSLTGIIEPNPLVYETLKSVYEDQQRE